MIITDESQFIIDNYLVLTRRQLAESLNVPSWWVKKQIAKLHDSNHISLFKKARPEIVLTEDAWPEEVKNYAFNLRRRYLKSSHFIVKALKKKFNFDIKFRALQYWLEAFKCFGRSKQDWMDEYLPKELIEQLLGDSYRIIDISKYIKKEFDVYISDDSIFIHMQKLGLLSYKLKRLKDIEDKSREFSKDWLSQRINAHAGIKGISDEMGFSKTIVMKRIKEEGLSLIKHRIVWSKEMESLRDYLLNVTLIEDILEDDFHQMMLGWLIGDGSLDLNGRFVVNHSLYQIDYLYLKVRILKKFVTNIVTVPRNEIDNYYGGREQLGFSCSGFKNYTKYLNPDGSKNYEKIISELNPLGWACYFMDDGSYWGSKTVITINKKFSDFFENKYCFGNKISAGLIEVSGINSEYLIPGFSYKIENIPRNFGAFWKLKIPELFNPIIKQDFELGFVNAYSINLNPHLLVDALNYYKKRGFPYFSISNDYLKKEYDQILNLNVNYFWGTTGKTERLRYVAAGNYIFKHFMPHMAEAKYKGISPLEIFNKYSSFYEVLEYTLEINGSILPNFVYDNLIHFNGQVVDFPCAVAKAIADKFTVKGDLIVDPCAGWGGRLIGIASILDRSYLGFESLDRTYQGLNEIIKFLNIKDSFIINSHFNLKEAPESCNLIFTSPPSIDIEICGESIDMLSWGNLMKDIFQYAERALPCGGHLILNISRYLKDFLPSTILEEGTPIYWFTTTRKRDIKKAEVLYTWAKK